MGIFSSLVEYATPGISQVKTALTGAKFLIGVTVTVVLISMYAIHVHQVNAMRNQLVTAEVQAANAEASVKELQNAITSQNAQIDAAKKRTQELVRQAQEKEHQAEVQAQAIKQKYSQDASNLENAQVPKSCEGAVKYGNKLGPTLIPPEW